MAIRWSLNFKIVKNFKRWNGPCPWTVIKESGEKETWENQSNSRHPDWHSIQLDASSNWATMPNLRAG